MAFRPFAALQTPVDSVEDEILDVLQRNIQNALSSCPVVVGEKRKREEEDHPKPPTPAPPTTTLSNFDEYRYKYQIEYLTTELENANALIQSYRQTINKNLQHPITITPATSQEEQQIMDLKMEVLELKHQLSEAQRKKEDLHRSSARSEGKRRSFSNEKSVLHNQLELLQKKNKELESRLEHNQKAFEVNDPKTQIEQQSSILATKDEDITNTKLMGEISALSSRLQAETARNKALEATVKSQKLLQLQIEDLKFANSQLKEQNEKQAEQVVRLQMVEEKMGRWESLISDDIFGKLNGMDELEIKFSDVTTASKEKDEIIERLRKTVETQEQHNNEQREKIKILQRQILQKSNEIETLKMKHDIEEKEANLHAQQEIGSLTPKATYNLIEHLREEISLLRQQLSPDPDKESYFFTFSQFHKFCYQVFGWEITRFQNVDDSTRVFFLDGATITMENDNLKRFEQNLTNSTKYQDSCPTLMAALTLHKRKLENTQALTSKTAEPMAMSVLPKKEFIIEYLLLPCLLISATLSWYQGDNSTAVGCIIGWAIIYYLSRLVSPVSWITRRQQHQIDTQQQRLLAFADTLNRLVDRLNQTQKLTNDNYSHIKHCASSIEESRKI